MMRSCLEKGKQIVLISNLQIYNSTPVLTQYQYKFVLSETKIISFDFFLQNNKFSISHKGKEGV